MAHIDIAERTAQSVAQAIATKEVSVRSVSIGAAIPLTTLRRKLQCVGEFTPSELFRIAQFLGMSFMDFIPTELSRTVAA
jgi:hypothetical protein